MDRFVQRQNIAKLSNLLAVELDPNQRSILMRSSASAWSNLGRRRSI
jgi:hypothetical protein